MSTILERETLKDYLPHRGRNLILDKTELVQSESETKAQLELLLKEGDSLKRDIFHQKSENGTLCYFPFMQAEFLALGCVVLFGKPNTNELSFFSSITNFELKSNAYPLGKKLLGSAIRHKDKAIFKRFSGESKTDSGELIASCDIMAVAIPKDSADPGEGKKIEPLSSSTKTPIDKSVFSYKSNDLLFISDEVVIDLDGKSAELYYLYPESHPFCEGHFPDLPIMMGITQWTGASDSLDWLIHRLHKAGKLSSNTFTIEAEVDLSHPDGTYICEIKGLKKTYNMAAAYPSELIATKKIGFRKPVQKNSEVCYRVRNLVFS